MNKMEGFLIKAVTLSFFAFEIKIYHAKVVTLVTLITL